MKEKRKTVGEKRMEKNIEARARLGETLAPFLNCELGVEGKAEVAAAMMLSGLTRAQGRAMAWKGARRVLEEEGFYIKDLRKKNKRYVIIRTK